MAGPKINRKKLIKFAGFGAAVFLIALLLSFGIFSIANAGKSYPKQYIGNTNFGGLKKPEIESKLKTKTEAFLGQNLILKNADSKDSYEITPSEIGLTYDINGTVDEIWQSGREGNVFLAIGKQIRSIFAKTNHRASFALNDEILSQKISTIAVSLDQPEQDFSIAYNDEKFELKTERKEGKRVDQDKVKPDLKNLMASISIKDCPFALQKFTPKIKEEKANATLRQANDILAGGVLSFVFENQKFEADLDTLGGFISSKVSGDDLELIFNNERAQKFVETLSKSINVASQNAKLTISDGKVTIFQNSRDGKTLDEKQTLADIENAIFARIKSGETAVDPKKINLKVALNKAEIRNDQIDSLGIRELIGTASTNFKGSPANRVHNITVGANAINGVLLKPGETFSTLGHLGTIDAAGGYLEELVIKENRTAPEFGGGLCQVSSTLFRAALASGMKITERLNHKYRVSYYEPPVGMDATIYDPAPDFKFLNNYDSHVLIQSKIVGTTITFDFYGTKDGRSIAVSTPEVYDFTDPEPPITIETDTLAPGEKKQIEKAHQGATAKFDYKVTKNGEVLQEKTFVSKYVPWPEKWLVGKMPATTCGDGSQNGDETGIDCGGSCPNACTQ